MHRHNTKTVSFQPKIKTSVRLEILNLDIEESRDSSESESNPVYDEEDKPKSKANRLMTTLIKLERKSLII